MGMTEDDKRNCCLVEIQETEAKYYKTLEDIEKVSVQRVWTCVRFSVQSCATVDFFFRNFSLVCFLGLWVGSQRGNVSYLQIHWGAKMSQELIDMVIIGWALTGDFWSPRLLE